MATTHVRSEHRVRILEGWAGTKVSGNVLSFQSVLRLPAVVVCRVYDDGAFSRLIPDATAHEILFESRCHFGTFVPSPNCPSVRHAKSADRSTLQAVSRFRAPTSSA